MPKKKKEVFISPLIEIKFMSDGYFSVKLWAANEIYFEVQGKNYDETLVQICRVIPYMINVDGEMMETFDDAGRTKVNSTQINLIKHFAREYRFRNVNCALPGFDTMQQ